MANFILKPGQEAFRVVDGPYAGRLYQPGQSYIDIPPEEAHRFDEAVTPAKRAKAEPKVEAES